MTIETGGLAFPLFDEDVRAYQPGMTLRDWFAGQALAAALSVMPKAPLSEIAGAAYRAADALIAARYVGTPK